MQELIEQVRAQTTPGNRGLEISLFVAKALRNKEINLYESYLLSGVEMEFTRLSYVQPAWSNRVRIFILLELLNLKLLAAALGEKNAAVHWTEYAREAYAMNQERRPHYILECYQEYLAAEVAPPLLQNLQAVRVRRSKPFAKGPYHTEVFPYDECSCEALLLNGERPLLSKNISGGVEELLVELSLLLEE